MVCFSGKQVSYSLPATQSTVEFESRPSARCTPCQRGFITGCCLEERERSQGKSVRANASASLSLQSAPACAWPRDEDSAASFSEKQSVNRNKRRSWISALWAGSEGALPEGVADIASFCDGPLVDYCDSQEPSFAQSWRYQGLKL